MYKIGINGRRKWLPDITEEKFPMGFTKKDIKEITSSNEIAKVLAERYKTSAATICKIKRKFGSNYSPRTVSVITEKDIPSIRADKRTNREIAADFDVGEMAISQIKRRINWAWVK